MLQLERRTASPEMKPHEEKYSGIIHAGLKEFLLRVESVRQPDSMPFPLPAIEVKQTLEGLITGLSPYAIERFIRRRRKDKNILGLEEIKEGKKVVDYIFDNADQVRRLYAIFFVIDELGKGKRGKVYVRPYAKDVIGTTIKWLGTDLLALGIRNPNGDI